MDKIITVTNSRELKAIENIIFQSVLVEDHYIHVLKLTHSCSSELSELTKNSHPFVKIIKVNFTLLREIVALKAVLKGKLHTFCPSCGIATIEE